jgi:hypothetical protein
MNIYTVGGKDVTKLEYAAEESVSLNNLQPKNLKGDCSVQSPWRPHIEDKRMVLEYTHGLFIT